MTAVSDTAAQAAIGAAARELRLPTIRAEAARLAATAAREHHTHLGYLAEVLSAEIDDRAERRRARRVAEAKFPRLKRLADFNAAAAPTITPALLATLATGAWIDAGQPVVLLGDSGTGKTHLLIALGLAACEQGRRVRYVTCAQLVNELAEAADERVLSRAVGRYGRLDLLLLDELGYVKIDPRGAELLFQVITEREEKASIAIGTNLPFSEWGTIFPDPRLVAAIVDRVTFNAHIIETGTQSYRLRTTKTSGRGKAQLTPQAPGRTQPAARPATQRPPRIRPHQRTQVPQPRTRLPPAQPDQPTRRATAPARPRRCPPPGTSGQATQDQRPQTGPPRSAAATAPRHHAR